MAHPVALQGFDHIVLRVADKQAMIAFYTEVLGCTVDWDRPELGLTHLRAGPDLIDLVTNGDRPQGDARNLDHFCLRIAAFDEQALRAHLQAHGVEVDSAGDRYGAAGQGPSLYIRDPEGNTVELKGQPAP